MKIYQIIEIHLNFLMFNGNYKYINQVLTSHRVTLNLATVGTPFFLVYRRDQNLPLHQLLEPMQHFLGDPDTGKLNLENHCLTLTIAKKTLDNNQFRNAQETTFFQAR